MRKSMVNNKNQIINLIKKLYGLLESHRSNFDSSFSFIYKQGYGTLYMNIEARECYDEIIDLTIKGYVRNEVLSRRHASKLLDQVLFDIFRTDSKEEDNYDLLLERFFNQLSDPGKTFTFFIPIQGCLLKKPLKFGKIHFDVFHDNVFNRFYDSIVQHKIDKVNKITVLEQVKKSNLWEAPVAEVKVAAKDKHAGRNIAIREVLQIIDTINFLSEVSNFPEKIYLPGERNNDYAVFPSIAEDLSFNITYKRVGPLGKLNLDDIHIKLEKSSLFSKINSMLQNEGNEYFERLLLTSIQWAGQASVETRLPNKFLAYTIALESVLLPDSDHQSLSYKLKHRIANLLGTTKESKLMIFKDVGALYSIRSQIVHNGWSSVSPENIDNVKKYCLNTIIALQNDHDVNRINKRDEYTNWLNALTLS